MQFYFHLQYSNKNLNKYSHNKITISVNIVRKKSVPVYWNICNVVGIFCGNRIYVHISEEKNWERHFFF
jgi:hypothetical protein